MNSKPASIWSRIRNCTCCVVSWLENYSYAKSALWWAKLEGMPPDSNLTIYMGFASNTTNLLNNW